MTLGGVVGVGGMPPLCELAVSQAHQGDPAQLVALTIVVAQAVMGVASLVPMRLAERSGDWWGLLATGVLGSLALWLGFAGVLKPACARSEPKADGRDLMAACG